jgi:hypothetical protein
MVKKFFVSAIFTGNLCLLTIALWKETNQSSALHINKRNSGSDAHTVKRSDFLKAGASI